MKTTFCVLIGLFLTIGTIGCTQSEPAPTPQGEAAPIEGGSEHDEGGAGAEGAAGTEGAEGDAAPTE